jgi:molybdenum cofactor cytidylyltransferase
MSCNVCRYSSLTIASGQAASDRRSALPSKLLVPFEDLEGIVITLSDQPLVTADALNRILETHYETGKDIVASEYADTHGVPLFIGKRFFDEIAAANGNQGAKRVIARYIEEMTTVPLAEAAFDVDTPVDYERLTRSSGR